MPLINISIAKSLTSMLTSTLPFALFPSPRPPFRPKRSAPSSDPASRADQCLHGFAISTLPAALAFSLTNATFAFITGVDSVCSQLKSNASQECDRAR